MAMDNVEDIKSIEELRKAQAAAQAQGTTITNYNQWEQILEDLETAGIQSTGSYSGDLQLHDFVEEVQQAQKQQEMNPKNAEASKIDSQTSQDKDQVVKANVANGVSSDIMANYMKYYHLF